MWVYDFRVGEHFTLKTRPMRREHLDDFVAAYLPGRPHSERVESQRFKKFDVDDLLKRDKVNLEITWLKDPTLEDADSLLPPAVIAREIVDDLQSALNEFAAIAEALGEPVTDEIETGQPL
ncbi:hypothetical protein ACGFIV_31555 [Sphaerisporangium sp. NPDC049003]|uniref:hypothetical protein n=1 Tax=Sphaerisporangium sp. NPDC049003 TaxID=3364517 RepID=UPI003723205B